MDNMFTYNRNVHGHGTRGANEDNLYIAQQHVKSFSYLGATAWNNIPLAIRSATSVASFKTLYIRNYFSQN